MNGYACLGGRIPPGTSTPVWSPSRDEMNRIATV
jgi:hypothetical protein